MQKLLLNSNGGSSFVDIFECSVGIARLNRPTVHNLNLNRRRVSIRRSGHIEIAFPRTLGNSICVRNVTAIATTAVHMGSSEFREESTMLGYGLIGTLVIICLVVWLVRAL